MSRVKIVTPKMKNPLGVATSKGAFHLVGLTAREPSVKPLALNPDIRPFQSFLFCATSGTLLFTGMKRLFLPSFYSLGRTY
jgi:hypothetical protein